MNENIVGAISIAEKGIVDKANVNQKKKKNPNGFQPYSTPGT